MNAATSYTERDGSEMTHYDGFSVEYRDASHRYWIHQNGERTDAVSVTSVLKVLDKPALLSWAERCGAEGAAILARQGELDHVPLEDTVDRVRLFKLGMDAKRDAGAERGSIVHAVLEKYSKAGAIPDITDFDPAHRGYVQALCGWLLKTKPVPILVEQVVCERFHMYAGRVDLVAEISGHLYVVDLKTNPAGRVYDEAHLQAAAYEMALDACGITTLGSLLVAAGEDGTYEQVVGEANFADFANVLSTYRVMSRLRRSRMARERA